MLLTGQPGGNSSPSTQKSRNTYYPASGYYFMDRRPFWVGIHAGPFTDKGGHSHCDQLGLLLSVNGQDIFVDRGTGNYTADQRMRNHYRSSAAHNVLQINDWEQNHFGSSRAQLFAMDDMADTKVTQLRDDPTTTTFIAEHHGFSRFRPGILHSRRIQMDSDKINMVDKVTGVINTDTLSFFFHLNPGTMATLIGNTLLVNLGNSRLHFSWDPAFEARLTPDKHSPAYGQQEDAEKLVLRRHGMPEASATFEFTAFLEIDSESPAIP
jgi:hypothetical protein